MALCLGMPASGYAEDNGTLYVGWQGGSRENLMREKIFPAFEAAHNVKIQYVAGVSTELLARMQAQKANQELDVVLLDDGPMYQAVSFGLCGKLEPNPIFDALTKTSAMTGAEQYAAGVGSVALGLVYNADVFKKNGWAAPTSWAELENPRHKGREVVMSISNTIGLGALVAMARLAGGDENSIAGGFTRLIKNVKPNVFAWVPTSGQLSSLFQNREVDLAAWTNDRSDVLKESGLSIAFAYPSEGAVATLVATCPVAKQSPKPLAQEFVRYLLTPEVQAVLASGALLAPANRDTKLPPELQGKLALEDRHKLIKIDWKVVNEKRGEWTRRWTREVER